MHPQDHHFIRAIEDFRFSELELSGFGRRQHGGQDRQVGVGRYNGWGGWWGEGAKCGLKGQMGSGCEEFLSGGDVIFKVQRNIKSLGKITGRPLLGDGGEFFTFVEEEEVGQRLIWGGTR